MPVVAFVAPLTLSSLKDELANASIVISCYDRDGNEVKRVTSKDSGDVEDGEDDGQGSTDGGDLPPGGGGD